MSEGPDKPAGLLASCPECGYQTRVYRTDPTPQCPHCRDDLDDQGRLAGDVEDDDGLGSLFETSPSPIRLEVLGGYE